MYPVDFPTIGSWLSLDQTLSVTGVFEAASLETVLLAFCLAVAASRIYVKSVRRWRQGALLCLLA